MTPPPIPDDNLVSSVALELRILQYEVAKVISLTKKEGGSYKAIVKMPIKTNPEIEGKVFDQYLKYGWHIDFVNRDSESINYRFTKPARYQVPKLQDNDPNLIPDQESWRRLLFS